MLEPAIVLLNPLAGHGRAGMLRRPIERWLAHRAPSVPLLAPASADAALATLMVLAPRTRVVLVGGDGTAHAMLPAFLRHGHRLGLVAAGRQNSVARLLGVAGLGWRDALTHALRAPATPIDIGELRTDETTDHFVGHLALGLDAQWGERLQRAPWPGRRPRFWWALGGAWLAARATDARVWVDGALAHEGSLLLGSVATLARPPRPGPLRADDAGLEGVLATALGPLAALRVLPALLDGRAVAHPAVHRLQGQALVIDARRALALAADGEALPAAARITVRALPRALYAAGMYAPRPPPPRASTVATRPVSA